MIKKLILTISIILLLSNSQVLFGSINPEVYLDIPQNAWAGIKEGNAQCVLITNIKWRIRINGNIDEAKQATYSSSVHLQYNRTCATPYGQSYRNMSYEDAINEVFDYQFYTGMYYVEVESELNGHVEEMRYTFYVLTPPIPPEKAYITPYSYPASNSRPYAKLRMLNVDGKEITGPIVKFQMWIEDNGNKENMVMYWKIMTKWQSVKPIHPPNYNAPAEKDQYKTYIHYADWNGGVQEWDTRHNPSDIGTYVLTVYAVDEHGRFGAGDAFTFTYDPDGTHGGGEDPPADTTPPNPPVIKKLVAIHSE